MKKGPVMNKVFSLAVATVAVLAVFAFAASGCGDGSRDGEDPTDRLVNSGSINEGECKDACDKVADCMNESYDEEGLVDSVSADLYKEECRRQCGQSGNFDEETINCIQISTCDVIFSDCMTFPQ